MAISSSTLSSGTGVTGSSIGVSNSTSTGAAGTPGASSAVGNQQQQGPSGRERAIEALIDREPQGSYYRAARVVDDAVPVALASRPNLVTRGALVENALSLAVYDIDNVEKFDEAYYSLTAVNDDVQQITATTGKGSGVGGSSEVRTTPIPKPNTIDTLTKERILHYQSKVISNKLRNTIDLANTRPATTSTSSNNVQSGVATTGPPAGFVAALRSIYEDATTTPTGYTTPDIVQTTNIPQIVTPPSSSSSIDLRQILQAVSSHPMFCTLTSYTSPLLDSLTADPSNQNIKSGEIANSDKSRNEASLEQLLLNLSKYNSSKDQDEFLQGLLISVLALLTWQQQASTPVVDVVGCGDTKKVDTVSGKGMVAASNIASPVKDEDIDPLQLTLQVGPLLSLFPVETDDNSQSEKTSDVTSSPKFSNSFSLDSALLSYFGEAAAVYEERLEIQKARALARMQTTPEPPTKASKRPGTPPPALILSDVQDQHETAGRNDPEPAPAPRPSSTGNMLLDISEALMAGTEDDISRADHADAVLREAFEQLVSAIQGQSDMLQPVLDNSNNDNINLSNTNEPENNIDEDGDEDEEDDDEDLEDDDEDDEDDSSEDSGDDDGSEGGPQNENRTTTAEEEGSANGGDQHPQPEHSDDDEVIANDDESSSSSSSQSSSENGGMAELDRILDTDEEDEAVLRQALAMSMVEQEEKENTTDEGIRNSSPSGTGFGSIELNSGDPDLQVNVSMVGSWGPPSEENQRDQTETPISQSTSDDALFNTTLEGIVENEDTSNLPAFPKPPKSLAQMPFGEGLYTGFPHVIPADPDAHAPTTDVPHPEFDPFSLNKFGSIPNTYILMHLLRFTRLYSEKNRCSKLLSNDQSSVEREKLTKSFSLRDGDSDSSSKGITKLNVTLQLMFTLFLLTHERRNIAIDALRNAISRELQVVQGGSAASSHTDTDIDIPSGEEDDPALTFAMNYVEDDTPLSTETLENKGMRRKAAAAAHDNAALLNSLRKETDAWKSRVKLYSACTVHSIALVTTLLQSIVRQELMSKDELSGTKTGPTTLSKLSTVIPGIIKTKIATALNSLYTAFPSSTISGLSEMDHADIDALFQDVALYKGSISLWSQCIPLIHCSSESQIEVLLELINQCSKDSDEKKAKTPFLSEALTLPNNEVDISIHKLQALCRRLRTSDMLEGLVPKPLLFLAGDDESKADDIVNTQVAVVKEDQIQLTASSLVAKIGRSLPDLKAAQKSTRQLYLALCHRIHSKILLLDGFYTYADCEVVDTPQSLSSAKVLSTGDNIRVSTSPSSLLQFDSTKCSDSIAILTGVDNASSINSSNNGSSVNQRASKVWGTVLSSSHYSPKTGIHRWAIRLDKCERGHVFIGVATAQASTRTYVGGDKYGWGMIGTQALWHDRRKIRGDYGATFRTGSTIIITLDSDAGTLSFGCWKDATTTTSTLLPHDPMVQNILSPRMLLGQGGGTIEDWGVAFEGLPLDSRLYPAVGLYQRDDRVTLLTVESSGLSSNNLGAFGLSGGVCYYPPTEYSSDSYGDPLHFKYVRDFNSRLTWSGIEYVAQILESSIETLNQGNDTFLLSQVLPSLASVLCLIPPNVPILSSRFALVMLPHLTRCISELERLNADLLPEQKRFPSHLQDGNWVIQASTHNSDVEEYVVELKHSVSEDMDGIHVNGKGYGTKGKSKNGLVRMIGILTGSLLTLVEEWSEPENESSIFGIRSSLSSCVVTARLSLDGKRFDGTYRNIQHGSIGHITGFVREKAVDLMESRYLEQRQDCKPAPIGLCQAILCLAHGHLATMLAESASGDIDYTTVEEKSDEKKPSVSQRLLLKETALKSCFSKCSLPMTELELKNEIQWLKSHYQPPVISQQLGGIGVFEMLDSFVTDQSPLAIKTSSNTILDDISVADTFMAVRSGGMGSLKCLCPSEYTNTRLRIICALLRFCNLNDVPKIEESDKVSESLVDIWRDALTIIENGVRHSMIRLPGFSKKECCLQVCDLYNEISAFLLELDMEDISSDCVDSLEAISGLSLLYSTVTEKSDLAFLKSEMLLSSRRGILRVCSFSETCLLMSRLNPTSTLPIECIVTALPRQLGRGKALFPSGKHCSLESDTAPDLDGNYLTGLQGCVSIVRKALKADVVMIYDYLAGVTNEVLCRQKALGVSTGSMSSISLLLAVLTLFVGNIRKEDLDEVIRRSDVLTLLPKIFATHGYCLNYDKGRVKGDDSKVSESKELHELCKRDLSRAVVKCAVAAAHVITYQVTQSCREDRPPFDSLLPCLTLLRVELNSGLNLVKELTNKFDEESGIERRDEEFKRWCLVSPPSNASAVPKMEQNIVGGRESGLDYLRFHNTLNSSGLQSSSLKHHSAIKSPVGVSLRSNSEIVYSTSGGFANQYVSHWLHVLSSVLRSTTSVEIIANEKVWLSLLFNAIGLIAEYHNDELIALLPGGYANILVPARFRSRILRLLPRLLVSTVPNDVIADGLFHLTGISSSISKSSRDDEDCSVSRESISLLRHLFSCDQWRQHIVRKVTEIVSLDSETEFDSNKRVGVILFLAGPCEGIGRGSYVLLKPAAASALSSDHQHPSSGKSHPSGIGGSALAAPTLGATPHHVAGNGTEGVVTGLCRDKASAGIVSNIDMKNGICEVILVARDHIEPKGWKNFVDTNHTSSTGSCKTSYSGRHTLTVRALRMPLSGVVLAQEVPIILDQSLPIETLAGSMLRRSLESLIRTTAGKARHSDDSKSSYDSTDTISVSSNLSFDVLVLRCATVLLSDNNVVMSLSNIDSIREVFSRILYLAWPTSVGTLGDSDLFRLCRGKGIASLPSHEARYNHLMSMVRELRQRCILLEGCSETEQLKIEASRSKLQHMNSAKPTDTTELLAETPQVASTSRLMSTSSAGTEAVSDTSREDEAAASRSVSGTTAGSQSEEEEEENEAAATAAAHLREVAIAQMAELGLPRAWADLALRRTGGINIEAAVTFCLERGAEIERMLIEEQERDRHSQRDSAVGSSRHGGGRDAGPSNHLLRQLLEMGFPPRWCTEALSVTGNNVDEALTWILNNGERLSEEDENIETDAGAAAEEGEEEDSVEGEDEEDDTDGGEGSGNELPLETMDHDGSEGKLKQTSTDIVGWNGSITPLRFISGRANVDPKKMEISGLPTGGFSSVGTKGILLTSGKWYYEAILETAGCLQIGWADGSFAGHCDADRGDGCGDGPSSWAYDGWRRYRWHATATEWGCSWREGDVVGCLVDMDNHVVSFTLNGLAEEIGMGVAFSGEGFRPCGGVYACVSFNRREKLRLILGGQGCESFKFQPPPGYRGVGEAVLEAVEERETLISNETSLDLFQGKRTEEAKTFLCDFSDGEHGHELMAWAHRYYGSDASVHLGSGRSKSNSFKTSSLPTSESKVKACLNRRVEKVWKSNSESSNQAEAVKFEDVFTRMRKGYQEVENELREEIANEIAIISILLSRKLLLHLMIALSGNFSPSLFVAGEESDASAACRMWNVIEVCTSLRNAGWVGEAGAMAIAAEALGLGISSNEHMQYRSSGERSGIVSACDLDDGLFLPTCGFTQLLTAVVRLNTTDIDTSSFAAASAEAAMGSEGGGGLLGFLGESLKSACSQSASFREVLIAAVRRSVRLLAVVEYDGEDFDAAEKQEKTSYEGTTSKNETGRPEKQKSDNTTDGALDSLPDARLTSFITGLLLSKAKHDDTDHEEDLVSGLFQAWSVGMLSASLPWRMVCAFTASGILNINPKVLQRTIHLYPTLARFYGRFRSTVVRRVWAERAATPVCSRYVQSMLELLSSVERAVEVMDDVPIDFTKLWSSVEVDAATPIPLNRNLDLKNSSGLSWESSEGWISSDSGWEVWSGFVECLPVDWKTPSRSSVRTLMDGGDGPPMLREGCLVLRGIDWDGYHSDRENKNDDGKDIYDLEKSKKEKEKDEPVEKKPAVECEVQPDPPEEKCQGDQSDEKIQADPSEEDSPPDPSRDNAQPDLSNENESETVAAENGTTTTKKAKTPSPKLPLGTVVSVEAWKGQPAMARRVRWHLTGKEEVYRYGGDGGRFDLCHVETNSKQTRVKKRHALPESNEQCASRHGFGARKQYSVLLRLKQKADSSGNDILDESKHEGILEWPDFGAGIHVECVMHQDGAVTIKETELLFGSKDSGWERRFGQPSFVPGSTFVLSPTSMSSKENLRDLDMKSSFLSQYEELLGSFTFEVKHLRNLENGDRVIHTSEMRLYRGRSNNGLLSFRANPPLPPPLTFDKEYHAASLSLSKDGRTVSCISSDCRGTAFVSMGFTKGVHYWEVKLEHADVGSVFVGVAEKPIGSGSGSSFLYDTPPRLSRWHGWGFVNFRATYTSGAERVYGSHCHAGDTVGVLLDCDAGRVSFFFDGLKYGEHILNDLGCAFENLSPFGFNVDGCGSGGAGQGAPSGFENGASGRFPAQGTVRPRALWPVIGLRNQGDRVTISSKWNTSYGIDGSITLKNILAFDSIISSYFNGPKSDSLTNKLVSFPKWFINDAYTEFKRWSEQKWTHTISRGSGSYRLASFGLDLELDCSPLACAAACASLGLDVVLLAGDRVRLKRSAGRILELTEEALILGAYQGRLYYRIVSQKSEGGSLTEGGGRAWCFDESEVVTGLLLVTPDRSCGCSLPKLSRFQCLSPGGLKVVYENGAVVRSDIEIFDGSTNLGTIPASKIISKNDVLERRVNSCGVVRFRVRYEGIGEGWISARIRGGTEEPIVEAVPLPENGIEDDVTEDPIVSTPEESARLWYEKWSKLSNESSKATNGLRIDNVDDFERLVGEGVLKDHDAAKSDSLLASAATLISNHSGAGDSMDCDFFQIASALSFVLLSQYPDLSLYVDGSAAATNQAVASLFTNTNEILPSIKALLARFALLRAINRRARYALPWLSTRPCQEGSALFGGLLGLGTSADRAGRTLISTEHKWFQAQSIAGRIRSLRGIFFTSIKMEVLQSITDATTTPTPLSNDEYELPREIRTVRINRLKAGRTILSDDSIAKRKYSVFSQLQNETRNWGGASLRRGYVAKGHGGQKRAFKVKLIGEGVNDYSGPYREIFTDSVAELFKVDADGRGALGVLDPTPNNRSAIGDNRELFMFSLNGREPSVPAGDSTCNTVTESTLRSFFASLLIPRDEASREVEESLVFLGRLCGTAFRHRIPLDLPLPLRSVWMTITEEYVNGKEKLNEIDHLACRLLENEKEADCFPLLLWQQRMLNSFVEGLGNVLPVELLPLLTGEELRTALCGNNEIDVHMLKKVVEYEGYTGTEKVIEYFWEILLGMSSDERKQFLQFVWARNRLPVRVSDFEHPFKIQHDTVNTGDKCDQALPSASTCFFSLTLPEYSSAEILKKKLLFAISNVTTMETDFQTNSAEIAEGYR